MRKSIIQLVWIAAMWTLGSTSALAQDVGAVATGDWSTPINLDHGNCPRLVE